MIANLLSYVRLAAIPALLVMAVLGLRTEFLWLLAAAWATDAIDGPLARLLGQDSVRGARLDSVADRGLMVCIPLGVAWLWPEVLLREAVWVAGERSLLVAPAAGRAIDSRWIAAYATRLKPGVPARAG